MPVSTSAAPAPVNKSSSLELPGCSRLHLRSPYPAPSPLRGGSLIRRAPLRGGSLSDSSSVITVVSVVSSTITSRDPEPWEVAEVARAQEPLQPRDTPQVGTEFPPPVSQLFLDGLLLSLCCSFSRAAVSNSIPFWSESLSSWRSLKEASKSRRFSWATLAATSWRVTVLSLGIRKYSSRGPEVIILYLG